MCDRSTIVEHHRSAAWAEREYLQLVETMKRQKAVFSNHFSSIAQKDPDSNHIICDYCRLLTSNTPVEMVDRIWEKVRSSKHYSKRRRYQVCLCLSKGASDICIYDFFECKHLTAVKTGDRRSQPLPVLPEQRQCKPCWAGSKVDWGRFAGEF